MLIEQILVCSCVPFVIITAILFGKKEYKPIEEKCLCGMGPCGDPNCIECEKRTRTTIHTNQ